MMLKSSFKNAWLGHREKVALVYLFMVGLVSVLPINSSSLSLSDTGFLSFKTEHLLHAAAFVPAPVLVFYLISNTVSGSFTCKWLISSLLAILFSQVSEIIQLFLSYRAFSYNDLLSNFIGVFIGSILILLSKKV
jgi:glycopeptide antibiotics resistance protein